MREGGVRDGGRVREGRRESRRAWRHKGPTQCSVPGMVSHRSMPVIMREPGKEGGRNQLSTT